MAFLLVGDNRTSTIWGGRGTSIALLTMLSRLYKAGETLDSSWTHRPIPVKPFFHPKVHTWLGRQQNPLLKGLEYVAKILFGTRSDYVDEVPQVTVTTILRESRYDGPFRHLVKTVEQCEAVVVNGEGDMIFTTPPRRTLAYRLAMLELGVRLGKPSFYINAMVSDCPVTGCNERTKEISLETLNRCSGVTVRDLESYEYLQREGLTARYKYIPDALFSWRGLVKAHLFCPPSNGDMIIPAPERMESFGRLRFDVPYICVGGSSLAVKYPEAMRDNYLALVNDLKQLGVPVYLVQTAGQETSFPEIATQADVGYIAQSTPIMAGAAILANAQVFVSGRYHPSIMASLGGTPCVFLGSNSHKTKSLQQLLGYDEIIEYPAIPTAEVRRQIVNQTENMLKDNGCYRSKIAATVDGLAQESETLVDFLRDSM